MAATALLLNPEPIAGECHQSKVQELTDVIISRCGKRWRAIWERTERGAAQARPSENHHRARNGRR